MVSPSQVDASEICERIKKLGYGKGNHVHLYGERLEVVSDPFPQQNGIAVRVRTKGDTTERVILLPATVLQSVRGKKPKTHT